jgi:hypothetical protein
MWEEIKMFEHTSNGTFFAAVATGALILWLDSRTDRVRSGGPGRQFSLFGDSNDSALARAAPADAAASPSVNTAAPSQQKPTQAPSVEASPPDAT